MIYGLTRVVVKPGKMAEFGEILSKEVLSFNSQIGLKMVGSWHGYTGDMNGLYHLFVYNDLAEQQKARKAGQQHKDYQAGVAKLNALRVSQTNTLLEPNPWLPSLNWKQDERYSIYAFGQIVLIPGKMAEWTELSKGDVDYYAKIGNRWVGSWHGYTGNMNEIYNLFAYKDLAEMQKLRAITAQNPTSDKHGPLMVSRQITLIEPNPWSPMK
jgi:hypothetical protein